MGIVNVTPDSFSVTGWRPRAWASTTSRPLAWRRARVRRGRSRDRRRRRRVDLPRGAYGDHAEVDAESEAAVAVPVVRALADDLGDRAIVSIDTSKGSVARAALGAGAGIVNDVGRATRPGDGGRRGRERRPHRPHAQPGGDPLPERRLRRRDQLAARGDRRRPVAWRAARPDHRRPGHRLRQGHRREPGDPPPSRGVQGGARRAAAPARDESQAVPRRAPGRGGTRRPGRRNGGHRRPRHRRGRRHRPRPRRRARRAHARAVSDAIIRR